MTDGGSHFNNGDVCVWCEVNNAKHHITAAYAPWINGLVEGTNALLLGQLHCLCSLGLGEDDHEHVLADHITGTLPNHFDAAIHQLNKRIIHIFQLSPKEPLLGLIINTMATPCPDAMTELITDMVNVQAAYINQQQLDSTSCMVAHTMQRKAVFDRWVEWSRVGHIIFKPGQPVQVYDITLDGTLSTLHKILL